VLRDSPERSLREHLIATAATLIADRGSAGLTVRDVARAAGVADGALYNHFSDRDELFAEGLRAYVESVMDQDLLLPQAGEGTVQGNLQIYMRFALDVLGRILPAFLGFQHHHAIVARAFHMLANAQAGPPPLPHVFGDYLAAEQAAGRIAATANVSAGATLLVGVCHDLTLPRLLVDPSAPARTVTDEQIHDLVATVLNGLL
jgi:AcrR family transcriptional regulator